jgi:hypothetical protein
MKFQSQLLSAHGRIPEISGCRSGNRISRFGAGIFSTSRLTDHERNGFWQIPARRGLPDSPAQLENRSAWQASYQEAGIFIRVSRSLTILCFIACRLIDPSLTNFLNIRLDPPLEIGFSVRNP